MSLAALPTPGRAQTLPCVAEEATTAPRGTIVFEAGFDVIGDRPDFLSGVKRTFLDGPVLRLVFSPADTVEMDVEWTSRVSESGDLVDESDWGDVALRGKVRLVEASGSRPAVGARLTVTLPETSFGSGLGPNTLRMTAEALLTRTAGPWSIHANAGLGIHDEVLRPHEQQDFFIYGLAASRRAGGKATLFAEVVGRAGPGAPGAEARSEARAGLQLGRDRWRASLAARRGLNDQTGRWGISAGVTRVLRRPAPTGGSGAVRMSPLQSVLWRPSSGHESCGHCRPEGKLEPAPAPGTRGAPAHCSGSRSTDRPDRALPGRAGVGDDSCRPQAQRASAASSACQANR